MVLQLSQKITSEKDLRKLATLGLSVDEATVDEQIRNLCHDIQEAALSMLKAWQKTMPDKYAALTMLCTALRNVDLAYLVNVLEEEWAKMPAVSSKRGATPVPTVAAGSASGE